MKRIVISGLIAVSVLGCAGIQKNGNAFTTHAESFNIIGFQIPGDQYKTAYDLVPANGSIHTATSNPSDWSSVLGVINRIIGVSYTEVSGTTK